MDRPSPNGETAPGDAAATTPGRIRIFIGNAARHGVVPLANFVVAYLVIDRGSAEIWSGFVVRLVAVSLVVHVLAWGNLDHLVRAFSRRPEAVGRLWRSSLATRALAVPVAAAGFVVAGLRGADLGWTVLWLAAALLVQSLRAVVLYSRRFGAAVAMELVGVAVTAALLVGFGAADVALVVRAVALGVAARAVFGLAAFSGELLASARLAVDRRFILEAAPFFLTGLAGLLVTKTDLVVVAAMGHQGVGTYQLVTSLFIVVQSLAAIAYTPYLRELYRGDRAAGPPAASTLLGAGFALVVVAVPIGRWLLVGLYGLDVSWGLLAAGAVYAFPVFGYLPLVYGLYRGDREREVVVVSFVGALVNLVLTIVLVRPFGLVGALAGAAVSQWLIWVWYLVKTRSSTPVTATQQ